MEDEYKEIHVDLIKDRLSILLFGRTDAIELLPFVSILWGRGCLNDGQIILYSAWLTFGIQITFNR